ncbi:MAG: type II secretion system GspH family protein [Chitinispirillales bacterium]|jgi:type II secretory pathway pseudopilin PulG|nr:type II secretion system GspH family protein [Chitinispirillales bacterium]
MNKKGMTLLELLVYMVLAAFLLAPVIMLMQNSSVSMARDAVNTELRISGRDIVNIMYDDLKNTGFKIHPSTFKSDLAATYIAFDVPSPGSDPVIIVNDSSSITSVNDGAGFYDEFTAIMGRLNDAGAWVGIDTISYRVDAADPTRPLTRRHRKGTIGGANSDATQVIARNVAALKFRYSEDLVDWEDEIDPAAGADDLAYKKAVKYVKAVLVLKDNKKLSPVTKQEFALTDDIALTVDDKALYERYEVVIPVPNNGLFIEDATD